MAAARKNYASDGADATDAIKDLRIVDDAYKRLQATWFSIFERVQRIRESIVWDIFQGTYAGPWDTTESADLCAIERWINEGIDIAKVEYVNLVASMKKRGYELPT